MQQIGIIVNPRSKSVKKSPRDMGKLYASIGGELADVRMTADFGELETACRDFKSRGYPYIGITGGDGTIHQVMTRLIDVYGQGKLPRVVLLRGGTMDNISRDLSVKGRGPAILKRLVSALSCGGPVPTTSRDTITIEGRHGFIFGTGIITNLLDEAYNVPDPNVMHNLAVAARALRDGFLDRPDSRIFRRMRARVAIDGAEIPFTDIIGVLAATVEHRGMGFRLLPRAHEEKGRFHALVSGLRPPQIAAQVLRIKRGLPMKGELNFNGLGSRIDIAGDEPFSYTIDGDLYQCAGRLTVEIGPGVNFVEV